MSDHTSDLTQQLWADLTGGAVLPPKPTDEPGASSQAGLGSFRTHDFDSTPAFPERPAFTEMKAHFGTPDPEPEAKPERIDHAAEARRIMRSELNGPNEGNDPHGAAQAHALLALVEQQRLANLIAYSAYWTDDEVLDVDALIREGVGIS